jgi:hypothetical protein
MNNTVQEQTYFLRLLSRYDSDIEISLTGRGKWIPFFDIIQNPPKFPIGHRSILKNELVIEIDSPDWEIVRDGTRKIINLLDKWQAQDCYYLSFSGNNSIHIHVFFSVKSVDLDDNTAKALERIDRDEIRREIKKYLMRQIQFATDVIIDTNLSSKHLIRLEGSVNEKSGNYCTQIDSIPTNRPSGYYVKVPNSLPSSLWDLSYMREELNTFLRAHFTKKARPIRFKDGKPLDNPERLIEILRPIYIRGYRHNIISAASGYLRRHAISLELSQKIINELVKNDEEKSSRLYSLKEIYKLDQNKKIPGLPKLKEIIEREYKSGIISKEIAESVTTQLDYFHNETGGSHNGP